MTRTSSTGTRVRAVVPGASWSPSRPAAPAVAPPAVGDGADEVAGVHDHEQRLVGDPDERRTAGRAYHADQIRRASGRAKGVGRRTGRDHREAGTQAMTRGPRIKTRAPDQAAPVERRMAQDADSVHGRLKRVLAVGHRRPLPGGARPRRPLGPTAHLIGASSADPVLAVGQGRRRHHRLLAPHRARRVWLMHTTHFRPLAANDLGCHRYLDRTGDRTGTPAVAVDAQGVRTSSRAKRAARWSPRRRRAAGIRGADLKGSDVLEDLAAGELGSPGSSSCTRPCRTGSPTGARRSRASSLVLQVSWRHPHAPEPSRALATSPSLHHPLLHRRGG